MYADNMEHPSSKPAGLQEASDSVNRWHKKAITVNGNKTEVRFEKRGKLALEITWEYPCNQP
jgi:hypothetical protein